MKFTFQLKCKCLKFFLFSKIGSNICFTILSGVLLMKVGNCSQTDKCHPLQWIRRAVNSRSAKSFCNNVSRAFYVYFQVLSLKIRKVTVERSVNKVLHLVNCILDDGMNLVRRNVETCLVASSMFQSLFGEGKA